MASLNCPTLQKIGKIAQTATENGPDKGRFSGPKSAKTLANDLVHSRD
jgi:hypothetical protein